ncbi:SRPBCC domain-containing protein [Bergeyella porcorum]
MNKITIKTQVKGDVQQVWNAYTNPQHIINWNFATPEWHCPATANDLRIGGEYFTRMEAKDGSFGFDFKAIYKELTPEQSFVYVLEDGREVSVSFIPQVDTTEIVIVFDPENQNPIEIQQAGWKAILDNFKRYAEGLKP